MLRENKRFIMSEELKKQINLAWENRASLSPKTKGEDRDAIEASIAGLDNGSLRVASSQMMGNG